MAWKKRSAARRTVCVLSSHPFVLRELEQVLTPDRFRLQVRRVASSPLHQFDSSARAPLYVVDAQLPQPTTDTLISTIARRFPRSRIVVVSDCFREAEAFGLLRLGVKGLVPYSDLREKLPFALDTVAAGGFWAPRSLCRAFSMSSSHPHGAGPSPGSQHRLPAASAKCWRRFSTTSRTSRSRTDSTSRSEPSSSTSRTSSRSFSSPAGKISSFTASALRPEIASPQ